MSAGMNTLQLVHCPYCVEDDDFRVMTARADGYWFLCSHCAHVVIPEQPQYQCSCAKCLALERPPVAPSN
jgi:hypothetical protein